MTSEPVLVSACLLGRACRYDGRGKLAPDLVSELGDRAHACCPEEAGGLGTPRPKAWLVGGDGLAVWLGQARVVDEEGQDRTLEFQRGAVRALAQAVARGASTAVLKEGSPSCGAEQVTIEGTRRSGQGVTAALFRRARLSIRTR